MIFDQQLEKYAELTVKVALNIQEGQLLWISAPTGTEILVRKIVRQAYLAGARNVHVNWYDEEIKRTHYELASNEVFKQYPKWLVAAHEELVENGGAFLQIEADDPDLLKGISIDKITNWQKAQGDALDPFL